MTQLLELIVIPPLSSFRHISDPYPSISTILWNDDRMLLTLLRFWTKECQTPSQHIFSYKITCMMENNQINSQTNSPHCPFVAHLKQMKMRPCMVTCCIVWQAPHCTGRIPSGACLQCITIRYGKRCSSKPSLYFFMFNYFLILNLLCLFLMYLLFWDLLLCCCVICLVFAIKIIFHTYLNTS